MSKGRKIAFFTGAGASKAFEFPLTAEILPRILDRLNDRSLFKKNDEAGTLLSRLINSTYPGLQYVLKRDMPLITDVLSVVDQALTFEGGIIREFSPVKLLAVRRAIERAIYEVMDWEEPYDNGVGPAALVQTTEWLCQSHLDPSLEVALISTNYDTILEHRWFKKRKMTYAEIEDSVDFGFAWRDVYSGEIHSRPARPKSRVYKLHGSFNCLRCPLCDHVYINLDGPIFSAAFQARADYNQCHCEHTPLAPLIVVPSMVRNVQSSALLETWRHALEFLRTADEWIIAGYSFPPEDVAIRSLFVRALNGREKPPKILIVQRRASRDLLCRILALFPDSKFSESGMDGFAKQLPKVESAYEGSASSKAVLKRELEFEVQQLEAQLEKAKAGEQDALRELKAECDALLERLQL